MDEMTSFLLKILATLAISGVFCYILFKLQRKKQADADHTFKMTLMSRGMSETIIESQNDKEL
jgi:hypothetical protein